MQRKRVVETFLQPGITPAGLARETSRFLDGSQAQDRLSVRVVVKLGMGLLQCFGNDILQVASKERVVFHRKDELVELVATGGAVLVREGRHSNEGNRSLGEVLGNGHIAGIVDQALEESESFLVFASLPLQLAEAKA